MSSPSILKPAANGEASYAPVTAFVTEECQQKPACRELRESTIIYHKRRDGMGQEGEYLRVQGVFRGAEKDGI